MTSSTSLCSCSSCLAILLSYAFTLLANCGLGLHISSEIFWRQPAAGQEMIAPRPFPSKDARMAAPEYECLHEDLRGFSAQGQGTRNKSSKGEKYVRSKWLGEKAKRNGAFVVLCLPTYLKFVVRIALVPCLLFKEVSKRGHGRIGMKCVLRIDG